MLYPIVIHRIPGIPDPFNRYERCARVCANGSQANVKDMITDPSAYVVAALPVSVATSLVADGQGMYTRRRRAAPELLAVGIATLGVATDTISLVLARDAIADLLRRVAAWGAHRGKTSELILRIDDRIDLKLELTGGDPESFLRTASEIMTILSQDDRAT